jgi:hypothetical protein
MKRVLLATAMTLAPLTAHADTALMDKVRTFVPIVALNFVCDLRMTDDAFSEDRVMRAKIKSQSDSEAEKPVVSLHWETQAAYMKAQHAGNRIAFCNDFIAANSKHVKARVTASAEDYMSLFSKRLQGEVARDICGADIARAKLSAAEKKDHAFMKQKLQIELKVESEVAAEKGLTPDPENVKTQFCAGVLRKVTP